MSSRGIRFATTEERTKLLDDNDDNYEVSVQFLQSKQLDLTSTTNRSGFQAVLRWLKSEWENYPTRKLMIWLTLEMCQKLLHRTSVSKQRSVRSTNKFWHFWKFNFCIGSTWWYFGLVISQIQYSSGGIETGQQYSDRNAFLCLEKNEDTCQNGLIVNRNASFRTRSQRRGKVRLILR